MSSIVFWRNTSPSAVYAGRTTVSFPLVLSSTGAMSQVEAANLGQTSQPQLTPRSSEACRRTGVDPRELVPLPPEAFREPGQPEELQQLKFHHYENGRIETYATVQEERERIIREGRLGSTSTAAASGQSTAQAQLAEQASAAESTALLKEKRMVEKIQKRQQADIESMLMFELKAAQITEEKAQKVRQDTQRAEDLRSAKEAKSKAWAEDRRKWDEEKRRQEEVMEKGARRRAQFEMQREAKKRHEDEQKVKAAQHEAAAGERERQRKQEGRKQRQREIMAQRAKEATLKAEDDARKEQGRVARLEERKQATMAANAAERDKAARRVAQSVQQQADNLAETRDFYAHRMELEDQRRMLFTEQRDLDLERRKRAGRERSDHIRGVQDQMEHALEQRTRGILDRNKGHDERMRQVLDERHQGLLRSHTEKDMRVYQRHVKLERNRRRDEYRREMVSEKIRMETQRADDLKSSRNTLLLQRREMRNKSVNTRQGIVDKIDRMRQSNSFYLPHDMRASIDNPELLELMERCDEEQRVTGGKVTMAMMRAITLEMQAEGKLQEMLTGRTPSKPDDASQAGSRPGTAP